MPDSQNALLCSTGRHFGPVGKRGVLSALGRPVNCFGNKKQRASVSSIHSAEGACKYKRVRTGVSSSRTSVTAPAVVPDEEGQHVTSDGPGHKFAIVASEQSSVRPHKPVPSSWHEPDSTPAGAGQHWMSAPPGQRLDNVELEQE